MGIYIKQNKEDFLLKHGKQVTGFSAFIHDFKRKPDTVPVLLLNKGRCTVAAICFDEVELKRFNRSDVYVLKAYLVSKKLLKPWLS